MYFGIKLPIVTIIQGIRKEAEGLRGKGERYVTPKSFTESKETNNWNQRQKVFSNSQKANN